MSCFFHIKTPQEIPSSCCQLALLHVDESWRVFAPYRPHVVVVVLGSFSLAHHRFDFNGKLLTPEESASISTKRGMHHHADEAAHAGYTLEELFTMTKSAVMSQRSIALKTLTNIIAKVG